MIGPTDAEDTAETAELLAEKRAADYGDDEKFLDHYRAMKEAENDG